jgi:hypothetical protein
MAEVLVLCELNLGKANEATFYHMPSHELVCTKVDELVPSEVKRLADPTPLGVDLDDDEPVVLDQNVDKVLWALHGG